MNPPDLFKPLSREQGGQQATGPRDHGTTGLGEQNERQRSEVFVSLFAANSAIAVRQAQALSRAEGSVGRWTLSVGRFLLMRSRPPWFYRQSAVIPYRITDTGVEILLVTSRGGKRWIIPKGIIDPGTTALDSACKEAYEEAGIRGRPSSSALGKYQYEKWGGVCTVEVFTLEVLETFDAWPESAIRRRKWRGLKEAVKAVREPKLKQLMLRCARSR